MPKSRKARRNLFWNWFVVGIVLGSVFSLIALGYIIVDIKWISLVRFFMLLAFIFGWIITLYNAIKRKALFGSKADGLITGAVFSAQTVDWILNGIYYP